MSAPAVVCVPWLRLSLCGVAGVLLVACTAVPHMGHSAFVDAWGDRGPEVHARDMAWCVAAAESRRSLVGGCMLNRGWVAKTGA
ncbi:MAG: hypothetical protein K2W33_10690 [Burkholderiales bacterium]|jgi:hypothetical protein|nr:hypothetical protein [Burkholderiales bacterium]